MYGELQEASVSELRKLLDEKRVSSRELTKIFLDDIDNRDETFNAFISVKPDLALAQADAADRRMAKGQEVAALTGIPVGVKDVILVKAMRTTAGSNMLRHFVAPYDSTVVKRLTAAGAVILGKTNCDEFAMGSSNENSAYGPTRNPWNLNCVPGGSSGGSAAAVAAREVPIALGTDTGGSIRQPAAFCGIVGLKPTYGRVSRYGVVAFASSFDQVGPMARTVRDAALLLQTIGGHDPHDSTSALAPMPPLDQALEKSIKGKKIGYPKEFLPPELAPEMKENFFASLEQLKKLGAQVQEISLPHTEYAISCYYILAPAEASANLARYDGVRYSHRAQKYATLHDLYFASRTEGFGKEVRRRILLGTFALSSGYYDAYYKKGQQVRRLIRDDFLQAFKEVDLMATPTTPSPAFPLGSKADRPLEMYLSDIFTVSVSLAGLPGLALPSGFTQEKLPIGLQLIGKDFDEATLLQVGHAFEKATNFGGEVPPV